MKKFLLLLTLLITVSCSVQKRHYQKGYFVSWKKHAPTKEHKENSALAAANRSQKESPLQVIQTTNRALSAGVSNGVQLNSIKKKSVFGPPIDSCDVMIFRNGSEDRIKILELSDNTIKYKKCSMLDGPDYIIDKKDVFMVKYANGTNEVFKAQEPATTKSPEPTNTYTPQRYQKKNTKLATASVFFGAFGFYPLVLIGGIIAIITSSIQLHLIASNPERYGGERRARVGFVLGIVSVILWIMLIALIVLAG